jgi:ubiquinone/menaquinone biosynthesis C-methylase UbiE
MKMNALEKLAMNNPFRAKIQRDVEMPLLESLGGRLEGKSVLEIGCGRGIGTELILERLGAAKVIATDYDEDMLRRAQKRLGQYDAERLELQTADATALKFEDQTFDAVFNFAAIHHIPDWQKAITEIHRVLRPGGRFYFQEVTARWILRFPFKQLFEHPMENRFSGQEFVDELEKKGISIADNWVERASGDFIFGVGTRADTQQEA